MTETTPTNERTIIGRAERILFVDVTPVTVPAKIDTGADISSVWASNITVVDDTLSFELFAPGSEYYTGNKIVLSKDEYRMTRVANSFGHKEMRYVVKLLIEVKGRTVRTTFTLADRSKKIYPILLGRKLLNGKFLVDVSLGEPLIAEERKKADKLRVELTSQAD